MQSKLSILVVTIQSLVLSAGAARADAAADVPRCADSRLVVELFAKSPDIVHPIGLDFDGRGRLLVIESHTHFAPAGYKGPKHDRVRIIEDTDGDGRADRFTTFFEGTRATMDIAVHPDGSVYLATRNEVLRLRGADGDGKANQKQRLIFLETKGDYPHNGLSGLAFDSRGDLYFGMGENLGAFYRLIGADGRIETGQGEGGNIFWCTADGKKLRRVATGFWNPFGVHRDVFGRIFAVDNDPDSMPPCRLLHVVEGGDYGYQFRYGRSGRHPFQAWNGQLPGTLPMVAGTGEAPCEIISYESDGLPDEYRGDLFVASWADHRIERYVLKQRGASFSAERKPFIQGGKDFRPVGLAVAPDGSLFISDWVLPDYTLHGRGAIWHVRLKNAKKPDRPGDPRRGLFSYHRSLRENSARKLMDEGESGRGFLRKQLGHSEPRVRATALTALLDAEDKQTNLARLAEAELEPAIQALAVRAMAARGQDVARFLDKKFSTAVQMEASAGIHDPKRLLEIYAGSDPFLRHVAIQRLAQLHAVGDDPRSFAASRERVALLLAARTSGRPEPIKFVPAFLTDSDDEVRFLAVKWIADDKLSQFQPQLQRMLDDPKIGVRLFFAVTTALARIDGKDVDEARMADFFVARLLEKSTPAAIKVKALQMVAADNKKLTVDVLGRLADASDLELKREAIRVLAELRTRPSSKVLRDLLRDATLSPEVRAEAMVGLARDEDLVGEFISRVDDDSSVLREESLRALVDIKLSDENRQVLGRSASKHAASADLVARLLGRAFAKKRPAADKLDPWLARLEGPANADTGRRLFFHPRLGNCSGCHRVDGRGKDIGPDLSNIGRTDRRHILESILQPSNTVAPHYQNWLLEMADGRVLTGMLMRTHLDEYTYVDAKGMLFKLNTRDIIDTQPARTSIMPDGLADRFTDQELRDLLAYLESRR